MFYHFVRRKSRIKKCPRRDAQDYRPPPIVFIYYCLRKAEMKAAMIEIFNNVGCIGAYEHENIE